MNFYSLFTIFLISVIGISSVNFAMVQADPLTDIGFLQTGEINTSENQFHISNEIIIREFFNGNIIRVSGQTIEGFPYITYSKILDGKIDTRGMIFINGQFVNLIWIEKDVEVKSSVVEKQDDLAILVQYTQRVYAKNFAQIDIKIYDKLQNKLNDFNQNYGFISDTNINVVVLDEENQEYFSSNGTSNDKGHFATEFFIPENSQRQTLTVTINAENENSKSSKILQIFSLGDWRDGNSSPPLP